MGANRPAESGETERTARSVLQAATDAGRAAPQLAATLPGDRAHWLRAVADELDDDAPRLAALADGETALGVPRLRGEIGRTTAQLRHFADVLVEGSCFEATIDHAARDAAPPRPDLRRILRGIGPVAIFGTGSFPFAFSVAGGDTASALAAGCPVVVKAHPEHPDTSEATAEIVAASLHRAGAPRGTFGLVHGTRQGQDLVRHPAIRAAAFTGSVEAGRALFDIAVGRDDPIPFYGELGSLNPVLVSRGAAKESAGSIAQGLLTSMTLGVGQFCTKPGLVFTPSDGGLTEVIAHAARLAVGGTMLSERIAGNFNRGLRQLVDHPDVEVLAGEVPGSDGGRQARPIVLRTTASRLEAATELLAAECFGPTVLLVDYSTDDELASAIEALPGSLTATIHAQDEELGDLAAVLERLTARAGRIVFGGWPTGITVSWAQHHGGPWPATTAPLHTSVGANAIRRFLRPVAYQDAPAASLPPALREDNPLGLPRRVDGRIVLPDDGDADG